MYSTICNKYPENLECSRTRHHVAKGSFSNSTGFDGLCFAITSLFLAVLFAKSSRFGDTSFSFLSTQRAPKQRFLCSSSWESSLCFTIDQTAFSIPFICVLFQRTIFCRCNYTLDWTKNNAKHSNWD